MCTESGCCSCSPTKTAFSTDWRYEPARLLLNQAATISPIPATPLYLHSISPALPSGLSISQAGVISGTPTALLCQTTFTITAYGGNLALNKPTQQIDVALSGVPSRAVDGSALNALNANCASTTLRSNPWWFVDLGSSTYVGYVRIFAPGDAGTGATYSVLVGTPTFVAGQDFVSTGLTLCLQSTYIGLGDYKSIACQMTGRYVVVYSKGANSLGLCEVEVYAGTMQTAKLELSVYTGTPPRCFTANPFAWWDATSPSSVILNTAPDPCLTGHVIFDGSPINQITGAQLPRDTSKTTVGDCFMTFISGGYVDTDFHADWGRNDFTVSLWISPSNPTQISDIFSNRNVVGSNFFTISISSGFIIVELYDGITPGCLTAVPITLNTDWHHVAVSRGGNTVQIAIDGVPQTPYQHTSIINVSSADDFVIGNSWWSLGNGNSRSFLGSIADVRVYNCFKTVPNIPPRFYTAQGYTPMNGDCTGNTITTISSTTLAQCTWQCNQLATCKGFSFSGQFNQCYLKSVACALGTVAATGVCSGVCFYQRANAVMGLLDISSSASRHLYAQPGDAPPVLGTAAMCTTGNSVDPLKMCVFPFVYQGVTYKDCIYSQIDNPWCPTLLGANGVFTPGSNYWGFCEPCPGAGKPGIYFTANMRYDSLVSNSKFDITQHMVCASVMWTKLVFTSTVEHLSFSGPGALTHSVVSAGITTDDRVTSYTSRVTWLPDLNQWYVVCSGTVQVGVITQIWVNTFLQNWYTSTTGYQTVSVPQKLTLGGPSTGIFEGFIGEVIVFQSIPSTPDQNAVRNYLLRKWDRGCERVCDGARFKETPQCSFSTGNQIPGSLYYSSPNYYRAITNCQGCI